MLRLSGFRYLYSNNISIPANSYQYWLTFVNPHPPSNVLSTPPWRYCTFYTTYSTKGLSLYFSSFLNCLVIWLGCILAVSVKSKTLLKPKILVISKKYRLHFSYTLTHKRNYKLVRFQVAEVYKCYHGVKNVSLKLFKNLLRKPNISLQNYLQFFQKFPILTPCIVGIRKVLDPYPPRQ